jgi:hypothetical protein
MVMFCAKCGASNPDGTKFCSDCGAALMAAAPVQTVQQDEEKKKKAGGFWTSGAGIALVAILGVAVLAGITFGIILLVKGGANKEVDAATMQVWDEYESVLADDSTSLAQVNMDPNALTKTREDLDKTQKRVEALEKVLQRTGGTEARKQNVSNARRIANSNTGQTVSTGNSATTVATGNNRDQKADQMAAALEAYKKYLEKMNELYGVLTNGNLLDPTIVNLVNAILKDLQTLSADVKTTSGAFLANNKKVATTKFDPPVLSLPKTIATNVEKDIQVKQEAEKQRLEAERVAAEQAAQQAAAQAEAQRQAELQRQREAAAAEQQQPTDTYDCGDPNCPICHPENQ